MALTDRLIIFAVMLLSLISMNATGGENTTGLFSAELLVTGFLLFVINSIVYELRHTGKYTLALTVCNTLLLLFFPRIMVWSVPVVMYGLASATDGPIRTLVELLHTKSDRKRITVFRAAGLLLLVLILFLAFWKTSYPYRNCILVAIPVALYLSYQSCENAFGKRKLISGYDEARLEAIQEHRLRELEMKNTENEIYLATLGERNRIAGEIHDNVGHMLTRAVVQLQAVSIMNRDETLKPMLTSVSETVNEAMTSIRKSVHELHDEAIDLSVGLHEITKTLGDRFDVKVNTMIESPASGQLKNAILGIVKEAVTNIAKYSNGTRVRVEVIENVTFWKVLVWDNGKNEKFEYTGENSNGIGLEHIVTRAQGVGGRANIMADGDGFTVSVTIPKK